MFVATSHPPSLNSYVLHVDAQTKRLLCPTIRPGDLFLLHPVALHANTSRISIAIGIRFPSTVSLGFDCTIMNCTKKHLKSIFPTWNISTLERVHSLHQGLDRVLIVLVSCRRSWIVRHRRRDSGRHSLVESRYQRQYIQNHQ